MRRLLLNAVLAVFALPTWAQGFPRRTECLQWDQAYAQTVFLGLGSAALLSATLGLTIGFLFGRQLWWAAAPRARIWIAGGFTFLLAEFFIVVWPRVLPLGKLLYASLDPQYLQCQTMSFGGPGLLGGVIGEGVAAYAQWQAITLLLAGASAIGTLVAWVFSEAIAKNRGLQAMSRRGEA